MSNNCALCNKPLRWWQDSVPILDPDFTAIFEHARCQAARIEMIERHGEQIGDVIAKASKRYTDSDNP